ncbi:MAG: PD40 domain-containing protein [Opitutaceae bacterium]|nr:PD40 domain-containing protein [Cytophagales bacterium]
MKRYFSIFILQALVAISIIAQPVRLKLPRQINVPNYNHYAPSLSANGLTMIYCSDYYVTEGNSVDMKITTSKGLDNWGSSEDVTAVNKSGTLNQYGAHCISADGNKIYFTSRKTGGVGGFDIWVTEKKGGKWATAQNLGKPVNSTGSDGYPSLSADGKTLYFLRCATMANSGCQDCKLFMSEGKGQDFYQPAVQIPMSGHILYPRISKDGNSLTFSSTKTGGKGGYDIYQMKKQGDKWSDPVNMEFLNTPADEVYADIPSQAEAILYSTKVDGYLTLFRAKLPERFHPDKVIVISSKINVGPNTGPIGFIQISDNKTGAPISITKIEKDGKISAVLPTGKVYDVAVVSGKDKFYWSGTYDAINLTRTQKEEPEIVLELLQKNKLYYGNKALFDSTSYQTLPGTALECKRLSKIFLSHPEWKAEFILFPSGVSNNPPADGLSAFEKMKASIQPELSKSGISTERITYVNGFEKPEEEDSFAGWGIKFY